MENSMDKPLSHRPKKSGSGTRRKQNVMTFRVTAAERAELETLATDAGLTPGSYIRESLLKSPQTRRRRRPLADMAALPRLLGEINRVGGNVNQIARAINLGNTPLASQIQDVLGTHQEILAAVRAALGLGAK
jgi:Bacterial mobilisation protein (MobC)